MIKLAKNKSFVLLIAIAGTILFLNNVVQAQNIDRKKLRKQVSRPEKCWAVCHPFIVKKTIRLSKESLTVTDSIKNSGALDGDISGGRVDAFKHSYWMALLVQNIRWRAAWKLGKAHEKGNYLSYKKALKTGKSNSHDKVSSDMDMWNNRVGISIGRNNRYTDIKLLQQIIIDSIQTGKMKIIKKNPTAKFLDCEDNIIPNDSLQGKWVNKKCLVPSDYRKF